jgi:hypothetical protein
MNFIGGIDAKKRQTKLISPTIESNIIPGWLSHAEKNFIRVLSRVVANNAFIFAKVKVNDVLRHIPLYDEYDEECDFGVKTFDFVLCDKNDLSVRCVIELDDRPPIFQKMYPEYSYDSICAELGIPLLEVPARCGYSQIELSKYITPYLNLIN